MPNTHTQIETPDYGRPLSIEEYSNRYVIHPLSSIVERISIKRGISANFISFCGLGAGLLAGLLYYHQDHKSFILAAFLCMVAWHIFDGADGRIARATGTSSAFGRILDGICDHLVFGAVYIAFVLYLIKTGSPNMVWLYGIAAAASHGIQAAGYEERRQKYQRRKRGIYRQDTNDKLVNINGKKSTLANIYDKVQKLVSGGYGPIDRVIDINRELNAAGNSTQNMIDKTVITVRLWALLNANNRTIMLAVMAFIGQPFLYFIYEIILLNLGFIGLLFYERIAEAKISSNA